MSVPVGVVDDAGYLVLGSERATELCRTAFSACSIDIERVGEVSVALVPLDVMRNLNLKFRNIDDVTDVLSFTLDGLYGEMAGEVVVAPDYVKGDARAVEELVVHGILHLAGMDHGEDFEASEMARVQKSVLGRVGGQEG